MSLQMHLILKLQYENVLILKNPTAIPSSLLLGGASPPGTQPLTDI